MWKGEVLLKMRGRIRLQRTLLRFESGKKQQQLTDLDDIVNYLCSNFIEYRNLKEKFFDRLVQGTLNSLTSRTDNSHTNNKNNNPPSKRRLVAAEYDEDDQNELEEDQIEAQKQEERSASQSWYKRSKMEEQTHLPSVIDPPTSSSFCSSRSASAFDEDNDDGSVLPDLMKSKLRTSYMKISKSNSRTRQKPPNKNVELKISNQKVPEKIDMVTITTNESHRDRKSLGTVVGGEKGEASSGSVDGVEVPLFKDFGGMKEVLEELKNCVIHPIYYSQLLTFLGVKKPMPGILFHGPPGCGKTRLAHAIANEAGVPLYKVATPELISGVSGESEENIRELFSGACRTAPSIIFIDEIDAIAPNRDNVQRGTKRRIVRQLMTCMDDAPGNVFIIGATNKPNALDPVLRRLGRFDRDLSTFFLMKMQGLRFFLSLPVI